MDYRWLTYGGPVITYVLPIDFLRELIDFLKDFTNFH